MASKSSSRMKSGSKVGGKGGRGQRKSSSLPSETVEYLKAWMMSPEHIAHPYPTEPEKAKIMADTGIEMKQLTNWFVNNRKRYWKPRVEARLQQQAQAAAAAAQAHAAAVAVVTASAHTNPVSPEPGARPTLTMPPGSGFVTFDLSPTATREKRKTYPHLVETDFASVLADQCSSPDARAVSETSSSASVSTSEGDLSDTQSEDECSQDVSAQAEAEVASDDDEVSSTNSDQQSSGESSSPSTFAFKKPAISPRSKRVMEEEPVQTPRKKFRRASLELWRTSCQNACHAYDESLPSLEEATQLFGYVH